MSILVFTGLVIAADCCLWLIVYRLRPRSAFGSYDIRILEANVAVITLNVVLYAVLVVGLIALRSLP